MFLERIMPDGLEEHDEKASMGGRNITRLRFADGIGALAEEEQELEDLVESLDKNCTRYKMDFGASNIAIFMVPVLVLLIPTTFCARTGTIKIAILLARSYQNYFVSMEAKYIDMELRIGDRDPCSLFKNKLYFILFYLITLKGSSGHDI